MRNRLIICVLLFFTLPGVSGQKKWTLRECIDYAVENNIEIMQSVLSVENKELTLNTARNSRLPSVNGSLGQNFNFGRSASPVTNLYENIQTSYSNVYVSSSIPVYSGMRITNQVKYSKLDLMAAVESLEKAKENLELQVTSLYLETLFRKEILNTYIKQKELTEIQAQHTEVLVETGKVPKSQMLDIQAQLAQNELSVINAANNLDLSMLNLAQALNIVSDEGFDIAEPDTSDPLIYSQAYRYSPDEIYETAVEIKPHVREAEYILESSHVNLRLAKSEYYPSVSIGMSYGNNYSYIFGSNYQNENFRKQISNRGSEAIGINVSVPIFNRFQVRNSVRSAGLAIRNQELALYSVKLGIRKEIEQAYQSATAARAQYVAAERSVEASAEAYKYVEERYNVGKATSYELSEAQTKLVTSDSDRIQAKYELIFREKILDFYRGVPIDIGF